MAGYCWAYQEWVDGCSGCTDLFCTDGKHACNYCSQVGHGAAACKKRFSFKVPQVTEFFHYKEGYEAAESRLAVAGTCHRVALPGHHAAIPVPHPSRSLAEMGHLKRQHEVSIVEEHGIPDQEAYLADQIAPHSVLPDQEGPTTGQAASRSCTWLGDGKRLRSSSDAPMNHKGESKSSSSNETLFQFPEPLPATSAQLSCWMKAYRSIPTVASKTHSSAANILYQQIQVHDEVLFHDSIKAHETARAINHGMIQSVDYICGQPLFFIRRPEDGTVFHNIPVSNIVRSTHGWIADRVGHCFQRTQVESNFKSWLRCPKCPAKYSSSWYVDQAAYDLHYFRAHL